MKEQNKKEKDNKKPQGTETTGSRNANQSANTNRSNKNPNNNKKSSGNGSNNSNHNNKRGNDSRRNHRDNYHERNGNGRNEEEDKRVPRNGAGSGKDKQAEVDTNDPMFYMPDENIGRALASIPYNVLAGMPYDLQALQLLGSYTQLDFFNKITMPQATVAVLNTIDSFGINKIGSDGLNIAANMLYAKMRQKNSGAKNYEAPDLMMYTMALSDIHAAYIYAKRFLEIARTYSFYNTDIPFGIVTALGVNYKDLVSNFANYVSQLSILATKINSFALPDIFKNSYRKAFIYGNVFADSDSIRGQFYVYRKVAYYYWDTTSDSRGTRLSGKYYGEENRPENIFVSKQSAPSQIDDPEAEGSGILKFQDILDGIAFQLDAMFNDTDAHTMSGDLLKAFDGAKMLTVTQPSLDTVLAPSMDTNALAQIENCFTLLTNRLTEDDSISYKQRPEFYQSVYQENGLIKTTYGYGLTGKVPTSVVANSTIMRDYLLNSHKENPDFKDNIEWTRLMPTCDLEVSLDTSTNKYELDCIVTSCGSELIWDIEMFVPARSATKPKAYQRAYMIQTADTTLPQWYLWQQQFDWHPFTYGLFSVGGDIKVATRITYEVLKRINSTATYSLWYNASLMK